MKKILGCIICFVMLVCSVTTFGDVTTASSLVSKVNTMSQELTQGEQEDLMESVLTLLEHKATNVMLDQDKMATIDDIQELVDTMVVKLDAHHATVVVDNYCDLIMVYFESGEMTLKDVQNITDKLISSLGRNVVTIKGINQEHIKVMLKKITDKNALIQGQVKVEYQQILKESDLDTMLLDIERSYRVVSSGCNSYGPFKEVGRTLQKQVVLLSSTESVELTLESGMVKRLVADKMGISINHNGVTYQIPTTFLEKHIGDFVVSIKPVYQEDENLINVSGGTVKPLILRSIMIGYETNPELIKVSIPTSKLKEGMLVNSSCAVMTENMDLWNKITADVNYGVLTATVNGTSKIGMGVYQPIYTDLINHWGEKSITNLLAHNIAVDSGTMLYEPNAVMTRGEFTRMLINIVGTEGKSENVFEDVAPGSEYSDIIESIIFYGFTIGVKDNQFAPDTLLTREDMVTLACKMHEVKKGYKLEGGFLRFKDMNQISPYARDAVQSMEAAGYISGYDDNTFKPKNTVTKAEAVSVVNKILN